MLQRDAATHIKLAKRKAVKAVQKGLISDAIGGFITDMTLHRDAMQMMLKPDNTSRLLSALETMNKEAAVLAIEGVK